MSRTMHPNSPRGNGAVRFLEEVIVQMDDWAGEPRSVELGHELENWLHSKRE